jgi:aminoglycoside phosphotransferase (APT) family kinase protein
MKGHSSSLGFSKTELRDIICSLVPSWRDDALEDFDFLSGGYSNANIAFTRRSADQNERYVLRIPQRLQPYGELLVDVYADRFSENDLLTYLHTLHGALPYVAEQYSVPALLADFVGPSEQAGTLIDALPTALTQAHQPGHTVTCHNDLNPWNILVTPNGWVTLDWEFVGQNDALFDLVSLHQGLELEVDSLPDLANKWARGWAHDYSAERLTQAFGQFWLREWGWARFQMNAGNSRDEVSTQAAVAEAMLANLPQF